MSDLTVANTILEQLGGNKFRIMTGAKDFLGSEKALSFSIPRSKGINKVIVELDSSDTYTVRFSYLNRSKLTVETKKVLHGVYADMLQDLFTQTTGLYTKL